MQLSGKFLLALVIACASSQAGTVYWTDFVNGPGPISLGYGTIATPQGNVGVSITGPLLAVRGANNAGLYWNGGYWMGGGVDNYPGFEEDFIIRDPGSFTISFDSPVVNPVIAIYSLGAGDPIVNLTFAQSFSIVPTDLSIGLSAVGLVLTGEEGWGIIRFSGTLSQISFSSDVEELYSSYQIGADASTPEPSAFILAGAGLGGLAAIRRRRVAKTT